jgi:glycosyltransferase involved in cell wall biosynthesis
MSATSLAKISTPPRDSQRARPASLKVLFVLPWDQKRGGVTSVVSNVAAYLIERGHRIWFLIPGLGERPSPKTTQLGMAGFEMRLREPITAEQPLRSTIAFWLLLPRTVWRVRRLLRDHEIDIVNIHYPTASFVYFALCRLFSKFSLVVSVHGADLMPDGNFMRRYSWALRFLLSRSDHVTSPSSNYLETVLARWPQLRHKARYIHNGVGVSEFEMAACSAPDTPYALTIAMHNEKKALDVLLHAIAIARERGFNMKVMLVGDGPLEQELKQLAQRLGVADQAQFVGFLGLDAVRELLNGCSFFVLPSRSEPFGIALLEAMAVGKAVVATRVGGIPEFVRDGSNGILVEPNDPDALAEALCKMVTDASRRERMGMAGKQIVLEGFTALHQGRRFEALFAAPRGRPS